jgi:hypothetical protein
LVAGCAGGDAGPGDRNDDRTDDIPGDDSDGRDPDGGDGRDICAGLVSDLIAYDVSDSQLFFEFDYPSNWLVTHPGRHGAQFAHPETLQETSSDPIPAYSLSVSVLNTPFERDTNAQLLREEPGGWNEEVALDYDGESLQVVSKALDGTGNHILQVVLSEDYFGEPQYRGVQVHSVGGGGGLGADYPNCPETMDRLAHDVLDSIHPVETA